MQKYAISINGGSAIVGPYGKRESALRRAAWLMENRKRFISDAKVVPMRSDTEYFGKPEGNRINH